MNTHDEESRVNFNRYLLVAVAVVVICLGFTFYARHFASTISRPAPITHSVTAPH